MGHDLHIERIYRHPKSKVFYADARRDGKRERFSLGTKDRDVANAKRRAYALADADPREHCLETLEVAIATMIQRCTTDAHVGNGRGGVAEATRDTYEESAVPLLQHFGADTNLSRITEASVAEYVAVRSSTPRARTGKPVHSLTIAHELSVLRLTLKSARKRGVWDGDIARIVPSNKPKYEPRETWLTEHEAEIMLGELEDFARKLWAGLATFAGLRKGEINRLTWDRIYLTTEPRGGEFGQTYGEIRVLGTKTARAKRPVPIVPQLAELLLAVPVSEREGRVVKAWTNVIRGLTAAFSRALDAEASLRPETRRKYHAPRARKHITPNDLRRTFASWLIQAGVSNRLVADLLGHTTTAMVDRVYARIFGSSALHRAVSAIARAIEPAVVANPVAAITPPVFANVKPETLAKVNAILGLIDSEAADAIRSMMGPLGCAQSLPPERQKTPRGGARGASKRTVSARDRGN
jgi:integrase